MDDETWMMKQADLSTFISLPSFTGKDIPLGRIQADRLPFEVKRKALINNAISKTPCVLYMCFSSTCLFVSV